MKIAVIPARGGSKRIPRKNIKLFGGKPMLSYAIDVAKSSRLFDAILVSSDDEEILALAKTLGVTPLRRPGELAQDDTPTVPVISHAISVCEAKNWEVELVCCIYPTVPFLKPKAIIKAYEMMKQKQVDYLFSVAAYPTSVRRAFYLTPEGRVVSFFRDYQETCTQHVDEAYYDAGQFYWGKTSAWLEEKNIHANGHAFIVPQLTAVDIDTLEDWRKAELVQKILLKEEEYELGNV